MSSNFSVENVVQIWNDKIGDRFEIGPDRDGLDMVELRFVDETGTITDRIAFPKELCNIIADAIRSFREDDTPKDML